VFVVLSAAMGGCVSVSNYRVTNANATSATLVATATWQNGDKGSYYWQWRDPGSGNGWTSSQPQQFNQTTNDSGPIFKQVTGLTPNTDYQFRVCGQDTYSGVSSGTQCVDKNGSSYDPSGGVVQNPATFYSGMTGHFTGLDMGFGEQNGGYNWLQLENDPTTGQDHFTRNGDRSPDGAPSNSVAEFLDYDQADWVVGMEEWKGLANASPNGNNFEALREWAQKASDNNKFLLFTIGWNPPSDVTDPSNPLQPVPSQDAQNSLLTAAHNVWLALDAKKVGDYTPAPGDQPLIGNVRLEIGTEPNWNSTDDSNSGPSGSITRQNAQFWWDAINRVAYDGDHSDPTGPDPNPWLFGKGVVSGGLFTRPGGDQYGWGQGWVPADDYLTEAIKGTRPTDSNGQYRWWHRTTTYFDAYGIHVAHDTADTDPNNRTTWGRDGGVQSRVNMITDALYQAPEESKPIEITALLPTDTNGATDGQQQADDSARVWSQLQAEQYDHNDKYPLDLVVWNHIVDTGQNNFPCTGFMKDPNDHKTAGNSHDCQKYNDPNPGDNPTGWPYTGKAVWYAAHDWAH
jgi:hypothetical protein